MCILYQWFRSTVTYKTYIICWTLANVIIEKSQKKKKKNCKEMARKIKAAVLLIISFDHQKHRLMYSRNNDRSKSSISVLNLLAHHITYINITLVNVITLPPTERTFEKILFYTLILNRLNQQLHPYPPVPKIWTNNEHKKKC